jgi:hypothetical protein
MRWAQVSRATVYRWVDQEQLPHLKLCGLRFDPDAVASWACERAQTNLRVVRPLPQVEPAAPVITGGMLRTLRRAGR